MTSFQLTSQNPLSLTDRQALVIGVFEDTHVFSGTAAAVDSALSGHISELKLRKVISGKANTVASYFFPGKAHPEWIVVAGLGTSPKMNPEVLRNAAATVARELQRIQAADSVWALDLEMTPALTSAIAEGVQMGTYRMDTYRSKPDPVTALSRITVLADSSDIRIEALRTGHIIGDAVNTARNLANLPANDLTPAKWVDWIRAEFPAGCGIELDIIDAAKAKSLGMNLFLGVAQGSVEPPYMVALRYSPLKDQKPVGLIGKGVTFDSGGISIKPSAKMSEMKGDMSGAAAVLATMHAVKTLKPQKNILAVVALTENMPSGSAQRPSDVVTGMNGKTVEIINTDAEGRLVLADALCYAVNAGVSELVDLATLTGACSVALGDLTSAILGNDQDLVNRWLKLAEVTGERLWQLPLYDEYITYLKSEIADIVNASEGRLAGTCTGARFLQEFVGDTPWVHLDIASMMHFSSTKGYTVKGMSGVGVRNLIAYLLS
jgi:leucyl aminopeptidase